MTEPESTEDVRTDDSSVTISNEFSEVEVRKVYTPKGERLQIRSPMTGFEIRLDAIALESISWQEPDTFSGFLATPHGPEDH